MKRSNSNVMTYLCPFLVFDKRSYVGCDFSTGVDGDGDDAGGYGAGDDALD